MAQTLDRRGYQEFKLPTDLPFNLFKQRKNITSVTIEHIDFDQYFADKMAEGNDATFEITNPEYLVNNQRTIDGIFSQKFGMDMMSIDNNMIYSCECGKMKSALNMGKICPDCGTEVIFMDSDLSKLAFIDIAPYHVLTYYGYHTLKKYIKNLDDVISRSRGINIQGKIIHDGKLDLLSLYDAYDDEFFEKVGVEKRFLFTSKIPVISAKLRPLIRSGINMSVFKINNKYLSIVTLSNDIKNMKTIGSHIQILKSVNQVQKEFMEIWGMIEAKTKSKNGLFRKDFIAGRVDFSGRLVIVPGVDLKPYEITIPYHAFMVLYEEEIINRLTKIMSITTAKALSKYRRALNVYDPLFVEIINDLIKKGIWTLINRNPTISYGSILLMKIKAIHNDIKNKTMKIPLDILSFLGADYVNAKSGILATV